MRLSSCMTCEETTCANCARLAVYRARVTRRARAGRPGKVGHIYGYAARHSLTDWRNDGNRSTAFLKHAAA